MKATRIVKYGLISALLFAVLCVFAEEDEPTSYFGHGAYHCFYEDTKTKKTFSGRSGDRKESIRQAKNACTKVYDHPSKARCEWVDCVFK